MGRPVTAGARRVRVLVRGRVQGVGFRWFTAQAARELGVSGWVRNASDGQVELAAAGPDDAVERLLAVVAQGPPRAVVSGVDVTPLGDDEAARLPLQFEITR